MSRTLIFASAAVLLALTPVSGQAADTTPASDATAPAPAAPTKPPRKATAQQRAEADRAPPMVRAAFWSREASIDPTDSVAGVELARALRAIGQNATAAQAANRVLMLDPKNYDAMMEEARAYVADGQGFYAIDLAQRAHAMAAKDWRPMLVLGVAYEQVQREDDAQAAWREALRLSPDNPAVLSNMAMTLAAHGQADQAEPLLRRAVAQPGATLQERQNLSLVLGAEGKLAEAEKILREDLPPDQANADLAYLQALAAGHNGATSPASTPERSWDAVKAAGG